MNRLGLKNDIAIHCPTLEQWVKVLEILGNNRYKWNDGSRINDDKAIDYDSWHIYKSETCIAPLIGSNDCVEYFESNGFDVVEASDFIDEFNERI